MQCSGSSDLRRRQLPELQVVGSTVMPRRHSTSGPRWNRSLGPCAVPTSRQSLSEFTRERFSSSPSSTSAPVSALGRKRTFARTRRWAPRTTLSLLPLLLGTWFLRPRRQRRASIGIVGWRSRGVHGRWRRDHRRRGGRNDWLRVSIPECAHEPRRDRRSTKYNEAAQDDASSTSRRHPT